MRSQLATIWRYKSFWLSLVVMDLRTRYRRSILGVGWSLMNPLMMTVVFCIVFASWMPNPDWRNYGPYFLCGMTLFEFVRASALGGCTTFFRNEAYIRQYPLPLAIYVLRTVLGAGIHFLIGTGVVILALILIQGPSTHDQVITELQKIKGGADQETRYKIDQAIDEAERNIASEPRVNSTVKVKPEQVQNLVNDFAGSDSAKRLAAKETLEKLFQTEHHWYRPLLMLQMILPAMLLLFMFCWSISTLASFVTVYFQDAQQLLEVIFQGLFFLTPIMFMPQMLIDKDMHFLLSINPIVTFLELIRTPLVYGTIPPPWAFAKASIIVAIFGTIAIATIAKLEKKLIFHL
jgi:ABC-type polysaccharide/polyol phosphate export permease